MMKKEARILGFDDGPFDKRKMGQVLVVGTIFRGGNFLDGLVSTKITKDGDNATKKLAAAVKKSKFRPQIRCIMLNGIAFGGFNVVDMKKLFHDTGIPVITIIRKKPDFIEIKKALTHLRSGKRKWELIIKAPAIKKIGAVYCQLVGIDDKKAREAITIATTHGNIPEPIRTAHLIAGGIVSGESRGGA